MRLRIARTFTCNEQENTNKLILLHKLNPNFLTSLSSIVGRQGSRRPRTLYIRPLLPRPRALLKMYHMDQVYKGYLFFMLVFRDKILIIWFKVT